MTRYKTLIFVLQMNVLKFSRNVFPVVRCLLWKNPCPVHSKWLKTVSTLTNQYTSHTFQQYNYKYIHTSCVPYSSKPPDDPVEDFEDMITPPPTPAPSQENNLPVSLQVPEYWPVVPIIAINRNPVFPRFIKIIEVSVVVSGYKRIFQVF